MKFIINILADQYLNQTNLGSFIKNVQSQKNVNYSLVLKSIDDIDSELLDNIKSNFPMIKLVYNYGEINIADPNTYWLNLSVADGLLPNAMVQWASILRRRKSELMILKSLNNDQSIQEQISDVINNCNEVHVNTIKSILGLPINSEISEIDLKTQLQILIGLQSYKLMDKKNRYSQTFNRMDLLGRNVLYHVGHSELSKWDDNFARLIINKLVNIPFLIQVNRPTLILSDDDSNKFVDETLELLKNPPVILDQDLLVQYNEFVIDKLSLAIKINKRFKLDRLEELKFTVKLLPDNLKRKLALKIPVTYAGQFLERK